jgi:hypothetical protein
MLRAGQFFPGAWSVVAYLAGADDVVVVAICRPGLVAFGLELLDLRLDGLVCAELESLGEVA